MTDKELDEKLTAAFDNVRADSAVKARIRKGLTGDIMDNNKTITVSKTADKNERTGTIKVNRRGRIAAAVIAGVLAVGGGSYLLNGGFARVAPGTDSHTEQTTDDGAYYYNGEKVDKLPMTNEELGFHPEAEQIYDKFGYNPYIWTLANGNFLVGVSFDENGNEYESGDYCRCCFYIYFAALFLKYNHYRIGKPKMPYVKEYTDTEYVAMCEGDDYWISAEKLERQVDFLERNDDFVLSYTNAVVVDKNSKIISKLSHKRYSGICTKSLITEGNYIITAGVCYRNKYGKEWLEVRTSIPFDLMLGDKPLWILLSTKGQLHYIEDYMVAYRRLGESASHTKDYNKAMRYSDNVRDINLFFNKFYDLGISESSILQDARLHKLRFSWLLSWNRLLNNFAVAVIDCPQYLLQIRFWKVLISSLQAKIKV